MRQVPVEFSLVVRGFHDGNRFEEEGGWKYLAAGKNRIVYVCAEHNKVMKLHPRGEGNQNEEEFKLAREGGALGDVIPRCYGFATLQIGDLEFDALIVERVAFTIEHMLTALHRDAPNEDTVSMVAYMLCY